MNFNFNLAKNNVKMGSVNNETNSVRLATKFYLYRIFKNYGASKKARLLMLKDVDF